MGMEAGTARSFPTPSRQLRYGREVIQAQSQSLTAWPNVWTASSAGRQAASSQCRGSVIVSGIGKAGMVGQKIVATLASTGTPSHFLHPAEALHGDLGRIQPEDAMLLLSQSGQTEEIVRLVASLREMDVPIIAVTCRADSPLARAAGIVIDLGPVREACPLGLAPTTSTTAMLALGHALALVLSRMRDFRREDFARIDPAGNLGRGLAKVQHHARPLDVCRIASEGQTVREVFVAASVPGRRSGAIMLVDEAGRLSGIFTDSDLARLFERHGELELDTPVREVMTSHPCTVPTDTLMIDAVALMARRKISELPVVDADGKPLGLIDITDVVGLLPPSAIGDDEPQVVSMAAAVSPRVATRGHGKNQE